LHVKFLDEKKNPHPSETALAVQAEHVCGLKEKSHFSNSYAKKEMLSSSFCSIKEHAVKTKI
jgi:hypothetical protein